MIAIARPRFPWEKPPRGYVVRRDHPLARGLRAAYLLNEGHGRGVYDSSGNENHLYWQNTSTDPTWIGASADALAYDANEPRRSEPRFGPTPYFPSTGGTDHFRTIGQPSEAVNFVRRMSVEIWTYITGGATFPIPIGMAPVNSHWMMLRVTNDMYFRIISGGSNDVIDVSAFVTYPPLRWIQFIGTFDVDVQNPNHRIFRDGLLRASRNETMTIPAITSSSRLGLGDGGGGTNQMQGSIGLARLWDRALHPDEVAELYGDPFSMYDEPRRRSVFALKGGFDRVLKTIFLTSTGAHQWTVPDDFAALLSVECIGGGGAGGGAQNVGNFAGGAGGGGGGYSKILSMSLTPGGVVDYSVGTGGTGAAASNGGNGADTWFGHTVYASASVGAKGGTGGQGNGGKTGGAGGSAAAGIGYVKHSGGTGGSGNTTETQAAGGAGSGGRRGNGGNGGATGSTIGAGGGGSGGGATGTNGFPGVNGDGTGAGGNNAAGAGGAAGVVADNPGNAGTVGGGGSGGNDGVGGAGGPGADYIQTSDSAVAGPGGGGGAGWGFDSNISGRGIGGAGGLYGGGGGAGSGYGAIGDGSRGGHGGQGIIIITYIAQVNLDVEYEGEGGATGSGSGTIRILFAPEGTGGADGAGAAAHVVQWTVPGVGGARAAGDIVLQFVADYISVGGAVASGSSGDTGFEITGTTRNSAGDVIPNCVVKLYRTSDDEVVAQTTSDIDGVYHFNVASNAANYYMVAYKVGAPDRFGTTENTLRGN